MRRALSPFLLLLLVLPAAARAAEPRRDRGDGDPVAEARRAHGSSPLPTRYDLPGATLTVDPAEQLAGTPGSQVRLEVGLTEPARGAARPPACATPACRSSPATRAAPRGWSGRGA
jgi:hypothetical protein